ncbi:MAG: hypothetical protein RLN75_08840 [Longimicrobiales bacterium]
MSHDPTAVAPTVTVPSKRAPGARLVTAAHPTIRPATVPPFDARTKAKPVGRESRSTTSGIPPQLTPAPLNPW